MTLIISLIPLSGRIRCVQKHLYTQRQILRAEILCLRFRPFQIAMSLGILKIYPSLRPGKP